MQNRAKIFMPFDALGGLREAIRREEEKHENKFVEVEPIDKILKRFRVGDNVKISYFYNFEYISFIGQIKYINYINRIITISNSKINFDDIDEIKKKLN
jgi:hypothetical protein